MASPPRSHRPRRAYLWVALAIAVLAIGHAASELATGNVAVLCLHGVDDPDERYAPWSLSSERFAQLLDTIAASGRSVVGPEALGRLGDGTFGVLLTFDDSRTSDRTIVQPALAARGWPAVFFVPVEGPTRQLRASELLALADAGHTLASHSQTHSRFLPAADESAPAFSARLEREARDSRTALEALLPGPRPVELFAYPRGEHPPEAVEAVSEAGYQWAFTTEYGYAQPHGDPLRTPRFMLFAETPMAAVDEFLRQPVLGLRRQLALAFAIALGAGLALVWMGPDPSRGPPREGSAPPEGAAPASAS